MTAEELNENCGIAAVSLESSLDKHPVGGAAFYIYNLLLQQQNRGQLSAGLTTYNPKRQELLNTFKDLGTVPTAFRAHHQGKHLSIMQKYSGIKGIGSVRYATCGTNDTCSAMPIERMHGRKWKWFSYAFNGQISNFSELKKDLNSNGYHLFTDTDTEVMMHFIAREMAGDIKKDLSEVVGNASKDWDGAYSSAYVDADGRLALFRDPFGFRPLVYGKKDDVVFAASETAALTNMDVEDIKVLEPGHLAQIENGSITVKRFAPKKEFKHCMFEWVYFANVVSEFDGASVYNARYKLGELLAKNEKTKFDGNTIVVPVPDTAKPAADAYALQMGLPSQEGLIRNRYIGRTFIEGHKRMEKVKAKFTLNKAVLRGKKVILVEDSIVRGTTAKTLVNYIRTEGKALEVHMRVVCPPILFPCFYGIDMSTMNELTANNVMTKKELQEFSGKELSEEIMERIRNYIGADSLQYQTLDHLVEAIGKPKNSLCTACLTGKYPTPAGEKLIQIAFEERKENSPIQQTIEKRTYERS
ncbi:MAG: amidophosphoribosyltransferase [Candidatus Diapherotrites archaeon]|nr:amidophosphoribosyltransferase [Candidatus Diapherotrites archaeon]